MYLKFSNAVIFGVTFSALAMLAIIIIRRIKTENGWRDVCQYIRTDWLRNKNRGGLTELTIAFSAIMMGAALRSGTIAVWRCWRLLLSDELKPRMVGEMFVSIFELTGFGIRIGGG